MAQPEVAIPTNSPHQSAPKVAANISPRLRSRLTRTVVNSRTVKGHNACQTSSRCSDKSDLKRDLDNLLFEYTMMYLLEQPEDVTKHADRFFDQSEKRRHPELVVRCECGDWYSCTMEKEEEEEEEKAMEVVEDLSEEKVQKITRNISNSILSWTDMYPH